MRRIRRIIYFLCILKCIILSCISKTTKSNSSVYDVCVSLCRVPSFDVIKIHYQPEFIHIFFFLVVSCIFVRNGSNWWENAQWLAEFPAKCCSNKFIHKTVSRASVVFSFLYSKDVNEKFSDKKSLELYKFCKTSE